jgi:dihydrofolate synthase/folylpolyglutamate synthase
MYQREGSSAYKADLKNIEILCNHLDFPQNRFRSVHIGGTNGKGSVSHMLASVLYSAGYKTGLYTSPHLKDFRERIRINGEEISEQDVIDFVEKNKSIIDEIRPSFFEMTVAMAYDYFAKENVDVAFIEVGLGGRLDSTNLITPLLSIITNISLDHTELLGNTIKEIAKEKAGIIKKNIPVIIGETHPDSREVFNTISKQQNSKIFYADQDYFSEFSDLYQDENRILNIMDDKKAIYKDLILDLPGIYQRKNIITVIKALELLKNRFRIEESDIRNGLKNVRTYTKLIGRWHILGHAPLIIADTGHNTAGINEVIKQINTMKFNQLRFIFGTVNDKTIDEMLKLLPQSGIYYFTKADIPRALDEIILKKKAENFGLKGFTFKNTKEAYKAAIHDAEQNDLIFIGGSTFIVAELI